MMAYGSDLLGEMHRHQSDEFILRGQVLPAIEVIRSATVHAAKVVRQEGRLGVVAPGAHADLVVVDGDPLADLSLLTGQGQHMPAIMKAGRFVKNRLDA
jgi:imidazolonepropionase-like amidohydrolase